MNEKMVNLNNEKDISARKESDIYTLWSSDNCNMVMDNFPYTNKYSIFQFITDDCKAVLKSGENIYDYLISETESESDSFRLDINIKAKRSYLIKNDTIIKTFNNNNVEDTDVHAKNFIMRQIDLVGAIKVGEILSEKIENKK